MLIEVKRREEQTLASTTSEAYHALMEVRGLPVTGRPVDSIRGEYETRIKYVLQRALGAINALEGLVSSNKELKEFGAECGQAQQKLIRKASEERTLLSSLISKRG
jgi:hypothetical protein